MDHRPDCPTCYVPMDAAAIHAHSPICTDCRNRKAAELAALIEHGKTGPLVCQACQGDGCAACGDTGLVPQVPGPVAA